MVEHSAMKDSFATIAAPSTGEFRDRGSKFIAFAFPITRQDEWPEKLEEVRKLHPKARHYCFAFRLGLDGTQFRAFDDGEPSGTAGRPILGQIDSFDLTNIFVVVVRYFGGTLLGTSGLINAYRTSTAEALNNATVLQKTVLTGFRLTFEYGLMSNIMNAVKRLDFEIVQQNFDQTAMLDIAVKISEAPPKMDQFKALVAGVHLEEIIPGFEIPGLFIEELGIIQ